MNFRYPIFLDLSGKKCLVTGEGQEVAAKVKGLLAAGAAVLYINPHAQIEIALLASGGRIRWEARAATAADVDGCFLVISALKDNSEIFAAAERKDVLCNSVDDPRHCRFSFGSVHRSGDLTLAISTNGWAPAIAVRVREQLEQELGPEYGELIELCKSYRAEITRRITDFEARRKLWYRIADSEALSKLREGHHDDAIALVKRLIEEAFNSTSHSDTSPHNESS